MASRVKLQQALLCIRWSFEYTQLVCSTSFGLLAVAPLSLRLGGTSDKTSDWDLIWMSIMQGWCLWHALGFMVLQPQSGTCLPKLRNQEHLMPSGILWVLFAMASSSSFLEWHASISLSGELFLAFLFWKVCRHIRNACLFPFEVKTSFQTACPLRFEWKMSRLL